MMRKRIKTIEYGCPICDKTHEVSIVQYMSKAIVNEKTVQYLKTVYYCEQTGEEFVPSEVMDMNLSLARENLNLN